MAGGMAGTVTPSHPPVTKYLSAVGLFIVKVTVLQAQAAWPGGAVERQRGDGGGRFQGAVGFGKWWPWRANVLQPREGGKEKERKRGKEGWRRKGGGGRESAVHQGE